MNNNSDKFISNFNQILIAGNRWFFQTPERALEQAYQAALKIQAIEDQHFNGQKVPTSSDLYSKNSLDCFQSDINKYLGIIKVKIAEFKISRFVLQGNNYNFLDKIKLIDELVIRYQKQDSDLLEIQPFVNVENESFIDIKAKPISQTKSLNQVFSMTDNMQPLNQKTGVLPRSIGRTMQKIKREIDPKYEQELINNLKVTRRNTRRAISFLLMLIIVPLLVQRLSKEVVMPLVNKYHSQEVASIFLNREMKEEALQELESFEHELKFNNFLPDIPKLPPEEIEKKLTEKVDELAHEYHSLGNKAIANCFADLIALIVFVGVIFFDKKGAIATKRLLNEIVYDLSDSAKAFILILFTDIFVGFHSPHGWEVILESIANHLGIAANHSAIFLFIATFPVILDTIFKYWIFRYLNQISPSAVATLKNMNE